MKEPRRLCSYNDLPNRPFSVITAWWDGKRIMLTVPNDDDMIGFGFDTQEHLCYYDETGFDFNKPSVSWVNKMFKLNDEEWTVANVLCYQVMYFTGQYNPDDAMNEMRHSMTPRWQEILDEIVKLYTVSDVLLT